jgi:hypothetical protein
MSDGSDDRQERDGKSSNSVAQCLNAGLPPLATSVFRRGAEGPDGEKRAPSNMARFGTTYPNTIYTRSFIIPLAGYPVAPACHGKCKIFMMESAPRTHLHYHISLLHPLYAHAAKKRQVELTEGY